MASVLEQELSQLRNSVVHLERSQAELKAALQQHWDPEYKEAIDENIVSLARFRARAAALEQEIADLKRKAQEEEEEEEKAGAPGAHRSGCGQGTPTVAPSSLLSPPDAGPTQIDADQTGSGVWL